MKCGVWLKGLISEMKHISHGHRTKKKHSKTSGNPKKQHIAILQKNLSVPKKQQHMAGWGVTKRNIVITFWTFLLQTWVKRNFLGQNMESSQSLSFLKAQLGTGKAKKDLFQVSYSGAPGMESHPWPKSMLRRTKAKRRDKFSSLLCNQSAVEIKIERGMKCTWTCSLSTPKPQYTLIIALGCHHYVPGI